MIDASDLYYAKSWMAGKTNYPRECSECKRRFVKGRGTDTADTTFVCAKKPTKVCKHAINDEHHECVHALCYGCLSKATQKSTPRKRVRKQHEPTNLQSLGGSSRGGSRGSSR
jgi:hypothetical protein